MNSLIRTLTVCAGLGLGLASMTYAAPVAARTQLVVGVGVNVPPLLPRYERHPPARLGYAWAPGYWRWNGHRHVWVAGGWLAARPGYHYVPAHWARRGPDWRFRDGYWAR